MQAQTISNIASKFNGSVLSVHGPSEIQIVNFFYIWMRSFIQILQFFPFFPQKIDLIRNGIFICDTEKQ